MRFFSLNDLAFWLVERFLGNNLGTRFFREMWLFQKVRKPVVLSHSIEKKCTWMDSFSDHFSGFFLTLWPCNITRTNRKRLITHFLPAFKSPCCKHLHFLIFYITPFHFPLLELTHCITVLWYSELDNEFFLFQLFK